MPYQFNLSSKSVDLYDGKKLVATLVCRAADYEIDMRLAALEFEGTEIHKRALEEMIKNNKLATGDDVRYWFFIESIYPKVGACTSTKDGSPIPTADEAWHLPTKIFNLWYEAAQKVNPAWFDEFKQITDAALKAMENLSANDPRYKRLKKKGRNRAR